MVVSSVLSLIPKLSRTIKGHMQASYTLEQSQEHSRHEKGHPPVQDVPLSQLETLLEEYKATNVRLTKQLETATTRQKLNASAELDSERTKVAKLEAGKTLTLVFIFS